MKCSLNSYAHALRTPSKKIHAKCETVFIAIGSPDQTEDEFHSWGVWMPCTINCVPSFSWIVWEAAVWGAICECMLSFCPMSFGDTKNRTRYIWQWSLGITIVQCVYRAYSLTNSSWLLHDDIHTNLLPLRQYTFSISVWVYQLLPSCALCADTKQNPTPNHPITKTITFQRGPKLKHVSFPLRITVYVVRRLPRQWAYDDFCAEEKHFAAKYKACANRAVETQLALYFKKFLHFFLSIFVIIHGKNELQFSTYNAKII